jgi:hypothetical protein
MFENLPRNDLLRYGALFLFQIGMLPRGLSAVNCQLTVLANSLNKIVIKSWKNSHPSKTRRARTHARAFRNNILKTSGSQMR